MNRFILAYHSISDRNSPIAVPPARFQSQMDELVAVGYRFETVSSILEPSRAERRVAICFDDGFQSVASAAMPALERNRLPATVFPIISGLGRRASWSMERRLLTDEPMLDFDTLGRLLALGWEVGSHGLSHRCLLALGPTRAAHELGESRATLETHLGVRVRGFAYPQGCWNPNAVALVRQSGYEWACSTLSASRSLRWNRWLLPRVTVGPSTTPVRFRAARVPAARLIRLLLPGRDSAFRHGHRHRDDLDSMTFHGDP